MSQGPLVACLYRPYKCSKASVLRVSLPATDAIIAAAASNASSRSVACSSGPSMRPSLSKPEGTVFRCFKRFLDVTHYRRTAFYALLQACLHANALLHLEVLYGLYSGISGLISAQDPTYASIELADALMKALCRWNSKRCVGCLTRSVYRPCKVGILSDGRHAQCIGDSVRASTRPGARRLVKHATAGPCIVSHARAP